jgi:hypothetical protein
MAIVLDGSVGISSIGTLTGVTSISSTTADTPVILQDSSSNSNTCRAWVNFNGTGTVAIRADFNVSSITDNGTGDYTVNFSVAMPDADYSTAFGGAHTFNATNADQGWANLRSNNGGTNPQQTGSVGVWTSSKASATGAPVDNVMVNVSVFR